MYSLLTIQELGVLSFDLLGHDAKTIQYLRVETILYVSKMLDAANQVMMVLTIRS